MPPATLKMHLEMAFHLGSLFGNVAMSAANASIATVDGGIFLVVDAAINLFAFAVGEAFVPPREERFLLVFFLPISLLN
jgi:hypothetical protein